MRKFSLWEEEPIPVREAADYTAIVEDKKAS